MRDHENTQTFETSTPVTREIVQFGQDKIRAVEQATGKKPAHLVRAVEALQREYDAQQTGSTHG